MLWFGSSTVTACNQHIVKQICAFLYRICFWQQSKDESIIVTLPTKELGFVSLLICIQIIIQAGEKLSLPVANLHAFFAKHNRLRTANGAKDRNVFCLICIDKPIVLNYRGQGTVSSLASSMARSCLIPAAIFFRMSCKFLWFPLNPHSSGDATTNIRLFHASNSANYRGG